MLDLNDLAYFVAVVDRGGFAPASRAIGVQKSKLSRRIAGLEEKLGVRLLQRSTRKFAVTEIGQSFYQHCAAMIVEAESAEQVIEALRAEPAGRVRIACPPGLLSYQIGAAIAEFMAVHPKVDVQVKAFNRPVDIITEGFDIAIRTGEPQSGETSLVARKLGEVSQILVAAPRLLKRKTRPRTPNDLRDYDGVAIGPVQAASESDRQDWRLNKDGGVEAVIPFKPRLMTDDLSTIREAALAGIGIAQMPDLLIAKDLRAGALEALLPDWRSPNIPVYAVFPSRRGLLPSVRELINHLAKECTPYRKGTAAGKK